MIPHVVEESSDRRRQSRSRKRWRRMIRPADADDTEICGICLDDLQKKGK